MLLGELIEMRETGGEWEVRGAAPLGHLWQLCTVVSLKVLARDPRVQKAQPLPPHSHSNIMLCYVASFAVPQTHQHRPTQSLILAVALASHSLVFPPRSPPP